MDAFTFVLLYIALFKVEYFCMHICRCICYASFYYVLYSSDYLFISLDFAENIHVFQRQQVRKKDDMGSWSCYHDHVESWAFRKALVYSSAFCYVCHVSCDQYCASWYNNEYAIHIVGRAVVICNSYLYFLFNIQFYYIVLSLRGTECFHKHALMCTICV